MDNHEIVKIEETSQEIVKISNKVDLEKDYKYSRETLEEILVQGRVAISDALRVAQDSEHPRAYEVVGSLIKTVGDVTDKLLDLQEKMKRLEEKEVDFKHTNNTTNNAVFIGSTSELLENLFKRNS